jgi:hypothetical protein
MPQHRMVTKPGRTRQQKKLNDIVRKLRSLCTSPVAIEEIGSSLDRVAFRQQWRHRFWERVKPLLLEQCLSMYAIARQLKNERFLAGLCCAGVGVAGYGRADGKWDLTRLRKVIELCLRDGLLSRGEFRASRLAAQRLTNVHRERRYREIVDIIMPLRVQRCFSLRQLAGHLNELKIKTPHFSKPWREDRLSVFLRRCVFYGVLSPQQLQEDLGLDLDEHRRSPWSPERRSEFRRRRLESIAKIRALLRQGLTHQQIADRLNAEGCRTPGHSRLWNARYIHVVLQGDSKHHGNGMPKKG